MKMVAIPEDLALLLGAEENLTQALIEAAVLELFREHRLSAGKAAEILGLSYREFLDLLSARDIPFVTTPPSGGQRAEGKGHRAEG